MSWPGEKQRHAMSSRGISTRGIKYSGVPENFWIVLKPGTHSTPGEVLEETSLEDLTRQAGQGTLKSSDIYGVYTDMDDAREAAFEVVEQKLLEDTSWDEFSKYWQLGFSELEDLAAGLDYSSPAEMVVSASPRSMFRSNKQLFAEALDNVTPRSAPEGMVEKLEEELL